MTKRIVALAGDGIGPEIMESALAVLKAATQSTDFDYEVENELFGGAAIDATGTPLPSETLTACKQADTILLAAAVRVGLKPNKRHKKDYLRYAKRCNCMRIFVRLKSLIA